MSKTSPSPASSVRQVTRAVIALGALALLIAACSSTSSGSGGDGAGGATAGPTGAGGGSAGPTGAGGGATGTAADCAPACAKVIQCGLCVADASGNCLTAAGCQSACEADPNDYGPAHCTNAAADCDGVQSCLGVSSAGAGGTGGGQCLPEGAQCNQLVSGCCMAAPVCCASKSPTICTRIGDC